MKSFLRFGIVMVLLTTALISCRPRTSLDSEHKMLVGQLLSTADVIKYKAGVPASIAYLDSAYASTPTLGVVDRFRKYQFIVQMLTFDKIDFSLAQIYVDSIRSTIVQSEAQSKYVEAYAQSFLLQGDIFRARKQFGQAHASYFKGKTLLKSISDTCNLNYFSSRIAKINFDQAKYKEAVTWYKSAYKESMLCKDATDFDSGFHERQGNLTNIGLCYAHTGQLDSALIYYTKALNFIKTNKNQFPEKGDFMAMAHAVIEGNMAEIYARKGQFAKAELLFKKSIATNSEKKYDIRHAQFMEVNLIRAYLERNDHEEAGLELKNLKALLKVLPNKLASSFLYELESQYYTKANNTDSAYVAYMRYVSIKDTLDHDKVSEAGFNETLLRLDTQDRLELVKKKDQINRIYLLASIVFTLMILSIAFLIWRRWLGSKANVIELRELNEQISEHNIHIQQTLSVLEHSQEENKNVLDVVAHHLQNRIEKAHVNTRKLLEDRSYTDLQRRLLEMMHGSISASLKLTDTLMQAPARKEALQKENIQLDILLHYCVNMLAYRAEEKSQKIILNTKSVNAFIDREKMWRVFSNLIANALKFSPSGAVVTVELTAQDGMVLLSVKDNGIGIPPEFHERIFNLYTEAKRSGTWGEKPFGMGLAISKQIVEAHGGKIWLESNVSQGTNFYVTFPEISVKTNKAVPEEYF